MPTRQRATACQVSPCRTICSHAVATISPPTVFLVDQRRRFPFVSMAVVTTSPIASTGFDQVAEFGFDGKRRTRLRAVFIVTSYFERTIQDDDQGATDAIDGDALRLVHRVRWISIGIESADITDPDRRHISPANMRADLVNGPPDVNGPVQGNDVMISDIPKSPAQMPVPNRGRLDVLPFACRAAMQDDFVYFPHFTDQNRTIQRIRLRLVSGLPRRKASDIET